MFIHLIADYGNGDPAFGEVIQRLKSLRADLDIYPTSVPAFSTLNTGFWIYQYALNKHPERMLIYANTAPRKDKKEKRANNEGEKLMYGQLKNGVRVVAVNAGYAFSFVKPYLSSFNFVNVANRGSQFRSRDFFPQAVVKIIEGDREVIGRRVEIENIPELPRNKVVHIDGYGNLKTTIRFNQIKGKYSLGQKIKVQVNNVVLTAIFTDGSFSVQDGELAFAPGSSGFDNPFMEVFLRGGSAFLAFHKPPVESDIDFLS